MKAIIITAIICMTLIITAIICITLIILEAINKRKP